MKQGLLLLLLLLLPGQALTEPVCWQTQSQQRQQQEREQQLEPRVLNQHKRPPRLLQQQHRDQLLSSAAAQGHGLLSWHVQCQACGQVAGL
jgi:hypothetical protein